MTTAVISLPYPATLRVETRIAYGKGAAGYGEMVVSEWTARESTRVTPSSQSIGVSWSVRSSARDGPV
jgi:hypothetical protein